MIPKLNRKIDIWQSITSNNYDEMNQPIIIEEIVHSSIWASVVPMTGSLMNNRAADTIVSKTTHKIIIRYNPAIKLIPKQNWIICENQRYEIDFEINPNFTFIEIFVQKVI